jgi:16S rRNA (cytidine1402-2'-O)-methyltransferase
VTGGDQGAGELVVVATPIGNIGDLSPRAAATLQEADVVCCEDTRHTGQLLARLGLRASRLLSVHAHNERERVAEVLELLERGERVALVSDAGTPTVSDPGERVISAAIAAGYKVTTVPGPSAAVSALVVAGLGTARWRFEGFLPRRGADRARRLGEIAVAPHPSVIYESPQRISSTLHDLANCCGGDRRVAVCRELTKLFEETWRGTLDEACERDAAGAAAGASRRQAAAEVAADLGVSKRFAYETSLARNGQ